MLSWRQSWVSCEDHWCTQLRILDQGMTGVLEVKTVRFLPWNCDSLLERIMFSTQQIDRLNLSLNVSVLVERPMASSKMWPVPGIAGERCRCNTLSPLMQRRMSCCPLSHYLHKINWSIGLFRSCSVAQLKCKAHEHHSWLHGGGPTRSCCVRK